MTDNVPPTRIFHFKGSFRMIMLNTRALNGTVNINAEAFSEPSLEAAMKNAVVANAMAPTEMDMRFNQNTISMSKTTNNSDESVKKSASTALTRYSQKL